MMITTLQTGYASPVPKPFLRAQFTTFYSNNQFNKKKATEYFFKF